MALINILRRIEASDGIPIDDAAQKALLIVRVNEAAKNLYETCDFKESREEEIFNIDVDSQVVALPWYVEHVRGWRFFNSRLPGTLDDKSNRYGEGRGNETWYQKWREIKHSPIQREISNESQLVLTLPLVESSEFTVSIVGATPNSSKVQEVVTFAVGDLEKTTTNAFVSPIVNIIKSAPTQYDITVADAEGNVMSVLPNHRTFALYKIIQIFDFDNMYIATTSAQVEVLFKRRFSEMVNDSDEFLFGDKYDEAIYWNYKSQQAKDPTASDIFHGKMQDALQNINESENLGVRHVVTFRKNPFTRLPYGNPFGPVRRS